MSATQTEPDDVANYDDLSDTEKAFVDLYIRNPEDMPVTIERKLDLEMGEGNRIATDYTDLIDRRREAFEAGELDEDDLFEPEDLEAAEEPEEEPEEVVEEPEEEPEEVVEEPEEEADEEAAEEAEREPVDAEDVEGPVIEHEGMTIPVDKLDEYWDERVVSYGELRQIAMDHDVRGDQSAADLIQGIKQQYREPEPEEAETEEEPAEAETQPEVSKPTEEKTYDDLSALQQRILDLWVKDPTQNSGDIEDKAVASPGYSARTFRDYENIRNARRVAYEEGILTDEHLNTPPAEDIVKDTSIPREEWEKLPEEEQPKGTPLTEVREDLDIEELADQLDVSEDELEEEAEELEEEAVAEVDEAEAEAADAAEAGGETAEAEAEEPTQLELPEAEYARVEDVQAVEDSVADLEATVASLQDQIEQTSGDGMDELESRVASIEDTVAALEESGAAGEADEGEHTVRLDLDDWMVVVRSVPEERDDILQQLMAQIH